MCNYLVQCIKPLIIIGLSGQVAAKCIFQLLNVFVQIRILFFPTCKMYLWEESVAADVGLLGAKADEPGFG